jgi:hypothetical protein
MKHFWSSLIFLCALPWLASAAAVDTGTLLEIRLHQPLTSYSTKRGTEVLASLIAPVRSGGDTLLPQGAVVRGSLDEVRRIGWGFRNLRASMRINFHTIELPDGATLPLDARVFSVDNAHETVDATGKIVGMRATSPMGPRAAGIARNLFIWDPIIQAVIIGATATVLDFPESEIHFPAGTELHLQLNQPLLVDTTWSSPMPGIATDAESRHQILNQIRAMTWRTTTQGTAKPADIVNLVFLGDPEWIERAFAAAGWADADRLTKGAGWKTFHSFAESRPYPKAPMSPMLLDENPATLQFSKSLNNYSRRHHLRVFPQPDSWNGRQVLAASSTQDLGITLSFSNRRLIHVIDRNIDNERAKIVNDLVFTGCVDAAELIPRPWVPATTRVSTGEAVHTDGHVAVLEINPCRTPYRTVREQPPVRVSGGRFERFGRQIVLTISNDFTFNNPIYQAGKGVKFLWTRMRGREDRSQPVRSSTLPEPRRDTEIAPATLPD